MPTFLATAPVPVVVDVPFGALHVVAGDRDDVAVTVLPADPGRSGSVRAAAETRVSRDGDAVTVTAPSAWRQYLLPFAAGGAAVTIELPAGSSISGRAGSLVAEGPLGAVDLALNGGEARVEDADRVTLKVSAGPVVVGRVSGALTVKATAGPVRVAEVAGDGVIHAPNASTTVGSVTGSLVVAAAHAEVVVGRVAGSLTAKAASGGIRVERAESGTVWLTTSHGSVEVGVPEGTAAWLDVASEHGSVRNQLLPADGPVGDERTVHVHAGTGHGDVVVRRP